MSYRGRDSSPCTEGNILILETQYSTSGDFCEAPPYCFQQASPFGVCCSHLLRNAHHPSASHPNRRLRTVWVSRDCGCHEEGPTDKGAHAHFLAHFIQYMTVQLFSLLDGNHYKLCLGYRWLPLCVQSAVTLHFSLSPANQNMFGILGSTAHEYLVHTSAQVHLAGGHNACIRNGG